MYMCMYVCVCVRACVCMCVCYLIKVKYPGTYHTLCTLGVRNLFTLPRALRLLHTVLLLNFSLSNKRAVAACGQPRACCKKLVCRVTTNYALR